MKILKISFSNINNLKGGPHVLSFKEEPLASAGIFAILGPTGSGKSTILDVITLALFNRIPRFSKVISKGEMNALGSVITHHTNEASASIEYEINGTSYISNWSISKNRNGKLKDYEMSLQKANGVYLDLKRSEVAAKNEEIIGLKYDQFIKSIILSQGEFSKFLKADKNERGKLLENITGTEIYRKIGAQAYQKFKETKESVELELKLLGEIQVLSEEDLLKINLDIERLKKEKTVCDAEVKKLIELKNTKIELKNIREELKVKNQENDNLDLDKSNFKSALAKLNLHNELSPLLPEVTNYKSVKNNQVKTKANLEQYKGTLKNAQENLEKVINEMSILTKEEVTETNFKNIMSAFEKEVNKYDAEKEHITRNGKALKSQIDKIAAEYQLTFPEKIEANQAIAELQIDKSKLLKTISESGLNQESDISDNRKKLEIKRESNFKLEKFSRLLQLKNEKEEKLKTDKHSCSQFEKQINHNSPLIEEYNEHIKLLREKDRLLNKQKADALKIASLEERRKELRTGDPCPLCGSTEHPFSEHAPEYTSGIEEEIKANIIALEKKQKELSDLNDQKVKAETSLKITRDKIKSLENEIKTDCEAIEIEKSNLQEFKIDDLASLKSKTDNLLEEIKRLELSIDGLEKLKINKDLLEKFTELDLLQKEFVALNKKRKTKFEGDDPSQVCNELQDKFSAFKATIVENKKAIEIESADLKNANEILILSETNLLPKAKSFGFKSIEELEVNLLHQDEWKLLKEQSENLIKQEAGIKASMLALKTKHQKTESKDKFPDSILEDITSTLEEKEKLREQLNQTIIENEAGLKQNNELLERRKGKEKEINKLEEKLNRWARINQLIGDATGNKFANFAQGLTLKNLLAFTNKRLQNLSDRYLLDMPGDDGSLRVVDQYQGNTERAVSTLSGGESFIISLALALSLSDMASRNVSLDSLFIDEGFGTLDQETLDVALSTLERLQTESQKTVGIISHVEALKERINVQIKLEKNAQGYSKLVIKE